MKLSNQSHPYTKGQSRGRSRGAVQAEDRNSANRQRQPAGNNFNTIQHSKNHLPVKPSAQVGNFVQSFPNQHQPSIGSNHTGLGIRPQYSQNSSNKDS